MSKHKDRSKHQDTFKHVSLAELYMRYPHIWRDVNSKTIPRKPYVPVKDISDHPYKLSFQKWKEVILVYMDELFKYLMEGYLFKIPFNMGNLRMVKYKYSYPNKNPELFKWCRRYSDGYYFKLKWLTRGKITIALRNKIFFNMLITTTKYQELKRDIEKDRSIIYRFSTLRSPYEDYTPPITKGDKTDNT